MEQKRVVTELTQGKEFAMQLKIHLDNTSSSKDFQEVLINKILDSYGKSLSLLTTRRLNPNGGSNDSYLQAERGITRMGSQVSLSESPCKEHINHEFKDPNNKDLRAKRKTNMEKWKNQVHVRGEMGVEEALDDGYDWRKYGQKDIYGAKHPRGYYRCTYRQLQGCLATKQVQKFDEDPSIFDITYHGRHTCNLESHTTSTPHNQSLRSFETLTTPFNFPSSSNNMSILDNTFDRQMTSGPTFSPVSELRDKKSPRAMNLDSTPIDNVSAGISTRRSHTVDADFSFDELEFPNFTVDN